MLLNLGLAADAAAAHTDDPGAQPEMPPDPNSPSYSAAFSLTALPFLGTLYNKSKQPDGPAQSTGSDSSAAMSPVASTPSEGESSKAVSPTLVRPQAGSSYTARKPSRPKRSYQLAHPVAHARHRRLKLRPKLLLQLQQVSHTPRPLPILDILPSTLYLPRLARKFPAMFRGRNGLGPNDLIIVMSELYGRTVASIPEKQGIPEDEDEDHREVVATICQMLQEDARLKGKAEICLNFGPLWEATPLASGSYEFVARTDHGVQVMRWALRGGKNWRTTAPSGSQPREDSKRFTFSVIDPSTRRHPVIASMTKNRLEVHDVYSAVARSTTGPITPSSGMSVASDVSDAEEPTDANTIALDDGLRTLIIITSIWVAFREGWSHNFNYGDPISSPTAKSLVSPTSSRSGSLVNVQNDTQVEHDDLTSRNSPVNSKRCMSISSIRHSNTMSPADGGKSFGGLSKRSNSTGAAFMDRAKRRTAPGISNQLNRHSTFTVTREPGREIVVSRSPSLRQNSVDPEDLPHQPDPPKHKSKAQSASENGKPTLNSEQALDSSANHPQARPAASPHPSTQNSESANSSSEKGKRRHRLSSLFTIFHRKHGS